MPELPDVEGFRRVLFEHTGEPIRTVRANVLGALYAAAAAGLPTLADGGYDGAWASPHSVETRT